MYTALHYADNFFSIALYGLILFYDLTKEELAGRRPLAKFLSIKLIVFFTFYQSFVVRSVLSALPVSR
jgi:Organic solute transporter Ostalpha